MSDTFVIELLLLCLRTTALLVGPLIATVVVVAIASNVVQTVTQVKDPALGFVPKVVAAALVFVVAAPWFLQILESFGRSMLGLIARGPL